MTNALQNISHINDCLKWIKEHKPEDYGQRFLQLVEERRKLKKISEAEKEKPAIAAFGESQKGKSYLIGNLLQKQKSPFMVKSEKGEFTNFVDRINPIGNRKEATGVVTRFTPFNTEESKNRYRQEHPVIVKLFSLANLAAILCDSYNLDIIDNKFYTDEEIKNISENILIQYKDKPENAQNILVEDDILDIKNYVEKYVKKGSQVLTRSDYFQNLSFVIRRIPMQDWVSVLKYLWHENGDITALFQRLFNALQRLGFAREVYVDFDAVMHKGENKNTIMSVDCLNGLDDKSWSLVTDVYLAGQSKVSNFPKCELCALCAETIFKIEPEYLNDEDGYYYDSTHNNEAGYMPQSTYSELSQKVKKDLLKDTDLLDFPGARNRLSLKEEFLSNVDSETGASNLVQMLLRGKVAFLFNNYSESRIINILLFCHDSDQPSVNDMYNMINGWVEKYVGMTPELRHQTVSRCGNVPPLFVIGTKFNIDMIETHKIDQDSETGLNGRWYGRFIKVLYTQSFKAESMQWFNNWDNTGSSFKNTFLLRDFKYSGCDGSGNNLYQGYNENDPSPKETALNLSKEFYDRLRSTFISNPDVKKFFANPAVSWDAAATMNNDGALYIIDKLSVVSKHMGETRNNQFCEEAQKITERIAAIMRQYYVSDDTTELLKENIHKANEIFREMDFAVQHSPEYFGHLIAELQLSETESFRYLHSIIPTLGSLVNDPKADYELISKRCGNFEGCKTDSDKWNVLINVYRFENQETAEKYLSDKNIKVSDLFKGEFIKRTNSAVITDGILKSWKKRFTEAALKLSDNGTDASKMDSAQMVYLTDCLIAAAIFVNLSERIEKAISPFVDILDIHSVNEYFVADMIASIVSGFVMDFGYSYLSDEQIQSAKRVAAEQHLPAFNYMEKERPETYDEDEATALFNKILSLSKCFTPAYDDNYNSWLEYMYVAFVANLNVPDYDRDANDKLKTLLEALK